MFLSHPQKQIPLLYRDIVLRTILTSAFAGVLARIYYLRVFGFSVDALERLQFVVPFLTILHHTLRLWRRTWWIVVYEVFGSLLEVAVVVYFFAKNLNPGMEQWANFPWNWLFVGPWMVMTICCLISLAFLLFDTVQERCRLREFILSSYEFSAGLCGPGHHWNFIFGWFTTRRRFSTDHPLICCIRGGFAILSFLGMVLLVLYASIWQPLQQSYRPGVKFLKMPLLDYLQPDGTPTLGSGFTLARTTLPDMHFQVLLYIPFFSSLRDQDQDQRPVVTMYPNFAACQLQRASLQRACQPSSLFYSEPDVPANCNQTVTQLGDILSCYASPIQVLMGDMLLLFNFPYSQSPYASGDFQAYLTFGGGTTDDIMDTAEPIGVSPGSNLHGWAYISAKERFSDRRSAILGMPKYRRLMAMNLRGVSPDLLPALPRDNNTATLRISYQDQKDLMVERDVFEASMLKGLALVGGIWTLVNGMFASIFGSTLLLVLFGIKPLSIYGLIHFFRPGMGSLVHESYSMSPEERDRIVGILKEHLLDVDEAERYKASSTSSNYNPVNGSSLPRRSQSDINVQA